ncbi:MAG: hypothetical protein E7280_10950 [Lachnospiraceae bacterium]|nr:hypothetical protein [Lachnospiraceae bacterium]
MRKKLVCTCMVICMLLGMATACGKKENTEKAGISLAWEEKKILPAHYDGTTNYKVRFYQTTAYQGIDYWFAKGVFDKKEAKAFIKQASKLLAYADKVAGKEKDGTTLYLNSAVNEVFIDLKDGVSYDEYWKIVNRIHKAEGLELYGLYYLYGIKHDIIAEEQTVDDKDIAQFFGADENLYLLDFCCPMIDDRIFDKEQVQMVKAAAKSFAAWYVKNYSLKEYEKLCGNMETLNHKELEKKKNAWLKDIGCKNEYAEFAKVLVKPTDIVDDEADKKPVPGDYEVEEEDAIWVWHSQDIKRTGYKEMIHKYCETEKCRKEDFAEAREFLKDYLPDKINKVKIFCYFNQQRGANGVMDPSKMIIKVNRCWESLSYTLLHEYIHYLTYPGDGRLLETAYSQFCVEGIAEWISALQLENRMAELSREYIADAYNEEKIDGKVWTPEMLEFDKTYGDYSFFVEGYEEKAMRDDTRQEMQGVPYPVDKEKFFYVEYASILKYVYETYGMEKTVELLKSDADFEKVLGESAEHLYFEAVDMAKEEMRKMEAGQGEK